MGRILSKAKNYSTGKTAVVLGDENLIRPILQYFPKNLDDNIVDFSVPVTEFGIKHLIFSLLDLKTETRKLKSNKARKKNI